MDIFYLKKIKVTYIQGEPCYMAVYNNGIRTKVKQYEVGENIKTEIYENRQPR